MNRSIPYDPTRHSLYKPCAEALFLDATATRSEVLLCAELSRLVYCAFEKDAVVRQAVISQLSAIGFSDATFFDANGLQAFLAADPGKRLCVLAYRGTQPDEAKKDVLADLKVALRPWRGPGRVHKGFADMHTGKWDDIAAALDARRSMRMLYTGHSLGAALATLSAALRAPDALYTFGSPRVGDAEFASSMAVVVHERYVDCSDIVCRIPRASWSYQHIGVQRYFDRNGVLHANISNADIGADQRNAQIAYLLQYAWRQPVNVLLRSAADHAPINYIHALRAAV